MAKLQVLIAMTLDGSIPAEDDPLLQWMRDDKDGFSYGRDKCTRRLYPGYPLVDFMCEKDMSDPSILYQAEIHDEESIDFDKLYKEGYRGIIFDIDNTLVTHGSPADERAIALFKHLKELGFSCLVLSNNKEPRVKSFAKQVGIKYIYKAGKPKPSGYRAVCRVNVLSRV